MSPTQTPRSATHHPTALQITVIGLFKTELIRRHGPWKHLDDVELATLGYVDWFNHRRLHGEIRHIPPAELEATHYRSRTGPIRV